MAKKALTEERIQKQQFWKQHIQACGDSGSSQVEYCRQHKLSIKSFTYWKRRFRQNTSISFVPVKVKAETRIATDISTELVLSKDGYGIEIKEGFNPAVLKEVLRTLKEL